MDDKELIKALKNGDIKAFDGIYSRYHRKLYAFALRFLKTHPDVEDLLQKVFILIWEKRAAIDPDKSFNNYLFTIVRNEVYDLLKKNVATACFHDQLLVDFEQPEDDLERKKLVELIYKLVENLPERRRQIFLMNRDQGLTYRQIAEKLEISENTVDTQIRHSLDYLRSELPKHLNSSTFLLLYVLMATKFLSN